MRIRIACLSGAILAVAATHAQAQTRQQPTPGHNIQLKENGDISDAAAVNRAISVMVKDVASCSPALAKDPATCACSFRDDLKKLRTAYDAAVAKHAAWNAEGTVVSYEGPVSGRSVTISLPAVKRQLEACAKR
ncbi:MAG TPA: hypothetical protein VFQ24_03045 [Terriglobia bacterium]|nr:hypothetical protein [Terriglobia bacterium]